ncbi:sensor signal transduction histidine kinase [Candidatus Omnitrophus magneticus]|uniref:histidine kinase n=1 Tax=Candidatus Omnitrophus magneticus TaxID=1609969 RepID=A0A0F0CMN8_9BACT|nr:sensor signal transduction histidine kinase [Candidatus Omnitrophus magneticus]
MDDLEWIDRLINKDARKRDSKDSGEFAGMSLSHNNSECFEQFREIFLNLAHEINNPLLIISGRAQMADLNKTDSTIVEENIKIILSQCSRIHGLMKKLLFFSSALKHNVVIKNINEIIDSSLKNVEGMIKVAGVDVRRDYGVNLPAIQLDEFQIKELFSNLFINAVEAMPQSGVLGISTRRERTVIRVEIRCTGEGFACVNF